MRRKIITLILIIGLWQGFALSIDKAVILPLPLVVFNQMFNLATSQSFYIAIGATLSRVALSFFLALIVGTILGVFSGLFKSVNEYLAPIFSFLQTIPQIAYILILLVWFKSLTALIIIVLLMILPVFYNNFGFANIFYSEYKEIEKLLIDNPNIFPLYKNNIHKVVMLKVKYNLYYYVVNDTVTIIDIKAFKEEQ